MTRVSSGTSSSQSVHSSASLPFSSVSPHERVFSMRDQAALWFSLGVGLLVMQVGAYLVPAMGTRQALFAIVIGSLLGVSLLAWVAHLAAVRGLNSASLMQMTYGLRFAKLPVLFNIVQLLGWATFELVIMRDGLSAIIHRIQPLSMLWLNMISTLFLGAILWLLISAPMAKVIRRFIGRIGLPLAVLSLIWLTIQFALRLKNADGGFTAFWLRPSSGAMSAISAIDLVIAMPISWLPLVADYARFSQNPEAKTAFKGTWMGYLIANIWCYTLGILIVSTASADSSLVATILMAQFGIVALGFILVDELDNAYGDLYSGSVSMNHIQPRYSVKNWGKTLLVVSILAALVLPMHRLEPFLLLLSSIFVPLFGVIIARLSVRSDNHATQLIHLPSVCIWLLGIAVYHVTPMLWPSLGSSVPSLAFTLLLGWLLHRRIAAQHLAQATVHSKQP